MLRERRRRVRESSSSQGIRSPGPYAVTVVPARVNVHFKIKMNRSVVKFNAVCRLDVSLYLVVLRACPELALYWLLAECEMRPEISGLHVQFALYRLEETIAQY